MDKAKSGLASAMLSLDHRFKGNNNNNNNKKERKKERREEEREGGKARGAEEGGREDRLTRRNQEGILLQYQCRNGLST